MTPPRKRPARTRAPRSRGFDFTGGVRRLCEDITRRLPQLGHVDMQRVAVSFSQTRRAVNHGVYASMTPMRFAGGSEHTLRRGRKWTVQRLYDESGREMLYILRFYLPRFLDLPLREKLTTVIHELWHIGPRFDGDLRRHGGRCYAHGSSQKQYDAQVERLLDAWLAQQPPAALYDFLRSSFRELAQRHGGVVGLKIPTPKLIPVDRT
jgi:hypothetical protein